MAASRSERSEHAANLAWGLSHVTAFACVATVLAVVVVLARATTGSNPPILVSSIVTVVLVELYDRVRVSSRRRFDVVLASERSQDAVLVRLTDSIDRFNHPELAMADAAATIAEATGATTVDIGIWVDDVLEQVASVAGADRVAAPTDGVRDADTTITGTIDHSGSPVGVISVELGRAPRARDLALVDDVTVALGIVARTAALRRTIRRRIDLAQRRGDELLEARTRLARVQLAERRRLERDLHDVCQQRAVVLAARLGSLCDRSVSGAAAVVAVVEEALGDVDRIERSIGAVLRETTDGLLGDGISGTLLADAAELPVPVEVIDDLPHRYAPEIEEQVYACCSEAVTNAVKHAGARHITVRLSGTADDLHFVIDDDGRGFEAGASRASGGLVNLEARLRTLGGRLELRSDGSGTRLAGSIPL